MRSDERKTRALVRLYVGCAFSDISSGLTSPVFHQRPLADRKRESGKPHGKTLSILASCLGVKPGEIETY